ncbi:hypothetical protein [Sulfitobacter mediterraneus]|mgnify:CR=1 FL=1|uniref:hypothetical protein n=1 Tax=Sulfitobacter mediterraneus TaxID=83219 RepID=UPI000EA3660A|nr:hypothetical protein [Sulfitobacter mediterraneus]UWR11532.1 hypothetical protein K3753_01210 [Sulfitobacter mediterraneus]
MIRAVVLAKFALASGALACPMPPDAIRLAPDEEHAPLAYAQMDAPPLSAPFAITITFCDPARQTGALTFDALMPAHRHGMNFTVDVNKIAANRFEVSNVVFHMPGHWEIRIEAEVAGQSYTYSAEVPLE